MRDDQSGTGLNRRDAIALGTLAAGSAMAGTAAAATASGSPASSPRSAPHRIVDAQGGLQVSSAGEVHQVRTGKTPALTTQQGVPIADDQNSLKAGARGPVLLEDFILREKINRFDHERIPERVVHAAGRSVWDRTVINDAQGGR